MKRLTKAEEELMQGIWEHGPCTVSQLIEKLGKKNAPHSTISSIVRILEKKGFVDHNTYGRTYAYYAIVDKKEYSKISLAALITNYFQGSANELVSFLVKEQNMSINELSKMINELENKNHG